MESKKINGTFRILSAIGIILVAAGHADFHIFDLGGLFPYYSFHVAMFVFISGYFYDQSAEEDILSYVKRKALKLMLPYFLWNLFYGVLAAVLRMRGFAIGEKISFKTLLLDPFLGGHQFGYNFAAWFVPALFLIEILNVCMRKILALLHLKYEWLITAACLLAGMVTVWFAIGGHVWGYYKFPGRILFMFPVYQIGQLYRRKLEHMDRLPHGIYFGALLFIQLLIVCNCGGLAYSTVWCTGFVNGPVVPYLTTLTGIAFWLRTAKILEPLLGELKNVDLIGKNTYAIMMHHVLGFMAIKGAVCFLSEHTPLCGDFDKAAFVSDIGYVYMPGGIDAFKWIYLTGGIAAALLIQALSMKMIQIGIRGGTRIGMRTVWKNGRESKENEKTQLDE